MTKKSLVVLDYGSGNLRSAQRALERVGATVEVTSDPAAAAASDGLVVPGVGAYEACMAGLRGIGGETRPPDDAAERREVAIHLRGGCSAERSQPGFGEIGVRRVAGADHAQSAAEALVPAGP